MGSSGSLEVNKDQIDQKWIWDWLIQGKEASKYIVIEQLNSIVFLNRDEIEMKKKLEETIKVKDYLEIK